MGSNLGPSRAYLSEAVGRMEAAFAVPATVSSLYHTAPMELQDQPWYLNQVVRFTLAQAWRPSMVLQVLKGIEGRMGREETVRYGPRIIDLDLVLYADWVLGTASLSVPHPKLEERAFVLCPLLELAGDLVNPRTGRSLAQLFEEKGAALGFCERVD